MKNQTSKRSLGLILRTSVNTLIEHPIIFLPLCISVFIQLLVLEILYFTPRWPLSTFFGPLIERQFGAPYLHYPFNLSLLPKLFYSTQIPLYIVVGAFLSAVTISIIFAINNDRTVKLRSAFNKSGSLYFHILLAAVLMVITIFPLFDAYQLVINRAVQIRSQSGPFFWLKSAVIYGTPYFHLLINLVITTLFIFLIPIIIIEKMKIHRAFILNFKVLYRSFWLMLGAVTVATLLYVPIIMLRASANSWISSTPEVTILIVALSIFIRMVIEAVVLTASTTCYLLIKEEKG